MRSLVLLLVAAAALPASFVACSAFTSDATDGAPPPPDSAGSVTPGSDASAADAAGRDAGDAPPAVLADDTFETDCGKWLVTNATLQHVASGGHASSGYCRLCSVGAGAAFYRDFAVTASAVHEVDAYLHEDGDAGARKWTMRVYAVSDAGVPALVASADGEVSSSWLFAQLRAELVAGSKVRIAIGPLDVPVCLAIDDVTLSGPPP